MGTQQMMLIVLGVILIGIAIAVGITMFGATNLQSNKEALVEDLQNIAVDASAFKSRPTTMGGGSGSYGGYTIPAKLRTNEDGSFAPTVSAQSITFVATSGQGFGTISAVLDSVGQLGSFTYTGEFQ
jgi:hypothetical protein